MKRRRFQRADEEQTEESERFDREIARLSNFEKERLEKENEEELKERSDRLYREQESFSNFMKSEKERLEKENEEELKERSDRLCHEQDSFSKFMNAEKERLGTENAEYLQRVEQEKEDLVEEKNDLLQQIATFRNLAVREQELVDNRILLEAYEQRIHDQEEQFLQNLYESELQVVAYQTWLVEHEEWLLGLQQHIATVEEREQQIDDDRALLQEDQQSLIAARGQLVQDQNVLEQQIDTIGEREQQLIVNETLLGTKEQTIDDERDQWLQECDQQVATIRGREDQIVADGNSLQQREDALNARRIQYRRDLADLQNGQRALEVDRHRRNMLPSLSHNQQGDTSLGVSAFSSLVILGFYMIFVGLIVYRCFPDFSSSKRGDPFVDSFYMTSVTTFTVGYGDIYPQESSTMIFCDLIVMLGHFIPLILCDSLGRIARTLDRKFLSTVEGERRRLGYRVAFAICAIFVAIFSGMAGIYVFERDRLASGSPSPGPSPSLSPSAMAPTSTYTHLGFGDIFHLSVMTVSTVGYGDVTFVTTYGRAFAALWIPFSVTLYSVAMTLLMESIVRASARRSMTGHI